MNDWFVALCGGILAAARLDDGAAWVLWICLALVAVLVVLALIKRSPSAARLNWVAPTAVAVLVALTVLPGLPTRAPAISWGLGFMSVAGILAATAQPNPQGVAPARARVAAAGPFALVAACLLILAAAGAVGSRFWPQAAVAQGWEWQGTYGILLGALPFLLGLTLTALVYAVWRGGRPS